MGREGSDQQRQLHPCGGRRPMVVNLPTVIECQNAGALFGLWKCLQVPVRSAANPSRWTARECCIHGDVGSWQVTSSKGCGQFIYFTSKGFGTTEHIYSPTLLSLTSLPAVPVAVRRIACGGGFSAVVTSKGYGINNCSLL